MVDCNLSFTEAEKQRDEKLIMSDRLLPNFAKSIARVSYEEGCKAYFEEGAFLICRFSGAKPLLRIFAEAGSSQEAKKMIDTMKGFIDC